jgi:hypothetical protein
MIGVSKRKRWKMKGKKKPILKLKLFRTTKLQRKYFEGIVVSKIEGLMSFPKQNGHFFGVR